MLSQLGAFVVQCGHEQGPQDLWTIQDGLHRLTRAPSGGVSEMSVNDSGIVVYTATDTIGADVHVLAPGTSEASVVGPGRAPAVAPDGRIAFVRSEQTRRPLRDDVYVTDGEITRKVATFPLVWTLFWHRGKLAAMVGPGRTRLVWDVRDPRRRMPLPGRGALTIQMDPDGERVAVQMPEGDNRLRDLGVGSRTRPRFRRVANDLYPLAWSPTGRFVLASDFAPSQRLSVVDVRRRVTARVGTLTCGRVVQAAWLPRGTKLPAVPAAK